MATTIGTFTVKGNDPGNNLGYNDFYVYASSNEYAGAGSGGLSGVTLVQSLDSYVALVVGTGGTMTYSFSGPGVWNGGTDTIVTISISDFAISPGPELIPYYLVFETERNYYPVIWQPAAVICEGAYELTLNACQNNYVIPSGLIPNNNYYFVIETNRGKRYRQAVSTNVYGDVQLWAAAPEFPEGFFTPEMFTYTSKVYTDSDLTNQVDFNINNIVYNTININFIYTIIVSD